MIRAADVSVDSVVADQLHRSIHTNAEPVTVEIPEATRVHEAGSSTVRMGRAPSAMARSTMSSTSARRSTATASIVDDAVARRCRSASRRTPRIACSAAVPPAGTDLDDQCAVVGRQRIDGEPDPAEELSARATSAVGRFTRRVGAIPG